MENLLKIFLLQKVIIQNMFSLPDGYLMENLDMLLLINMFQLRKVGSGGWELNHPPLFRQLVEKTKISGELFLKKPGPKSMEIIWLLKLDGTLMYGLH